jgi:ankyrin repeat protein
MPAFQPDSIDDRTPLMLAACADSLSELFEILLNGVEIDEKDHRGWTALTYAAHFGHYEIVNQLLDSGANPNLVSSYAMIDTPLAEAARLGHFDIVRLLIAHDADPNCYSGIAAARAGAYARWNRHEDISEFLRLHEDQKNTDLTRRCS